MSNNVILGTAFNYTLDDIQSFLSSLNQKYTDVVVLFTDKIIEFEKFSFTLIVERVLDENGIYSLPVQLNNPNNYRYFLYQQYLKNNPDYEFVMMTDVRDVVFQTNPFTNILRNKLHVAKEEITIKNCQYNSFWIKSLFGKEYFEAVAESSVYCSGTIIGSGYVLSKYLQDFADLMIIHGPRLDVGKNNMIIDQGIHIYWCLSNIDLVKGYENSDGYIFTMGYTDSFIVNREGKIITKEKQIYSIIHQYDRFPILKTFFANEYKKIAGKDISNSFAKRLMKKLGVE